jgi:hypothetical protein
METVGIEGVCFRSRVHEIQFHNHPSIPPSKKHDATGFLTFVGEIPGGTASSTRPVLLLPRTIFNFL